MVRAETGLCPYARTPPTVGLSALGLGLQASWQLRIRTVFFQTCPKLGPRALAQNGWSAWSPVSREVGNGENTLRALIDERQHPVV